MVKQTLIFIGYKCSIYVALIVFFITCFLGYIANLSVETIIKKSIIAGCIMGLAFFAAMRIFANYVPENIDLTNRGKDTDANKTGGKQSTK